MINHKTNSACLFSTLTKDWEKNKKVICKVLSKTITICSIDCRIMNKKANKILK